MIIKPSPKRLSSASTVSCLALLGLRFVGTGNPQVSKHLPTVSKTGLRVKETTGR